MLPADDGGPPSLWLQTAVAENSPMPTAAFTPA